MDIHVDRPVSEAADVYPGVIDHDIIASGSRDHINVARETQEAFVCSVRAYFVSGLQVHIFTAFSLTSSKDMQVKWWIHCPN